MRWDAPPEHRDTAEAVWQHLVAHRGAGLFLSSADGRRLLDWLDREVPLADILRAIERAAASRAKSGSRVPLGLGHVNRHLGKPTSGIFRSPGGPALPDSGAGTLQPLVRMIRERADGDALGPLLRALADDLDALGAEDVAGQAMVRVRAFHDAVYEALGEGRRAQLHDAARAALGDLVHMLEERELTPLIEERARHEARSGYAWLSAATVWDLVAPGESAP
jgi:hypothetical protein